MTGGAEASLFLSPVGHREAFLGNTGAGLAQSPGAVLFNPAGIAYFTDHPALSLSGSAVSYQEFSGTTLTRETGQLKSETLLGTAIFPIEAGLRMGVFYSDPGNIQDYLRSTSGDSGSEIIDTSELQRQSAVAGIAYAGLINAEQSWGVGINIVYRELDGLVLRQSLSSGSSTVRTQRNVEQQTSLVLTPGYMWQVHGTYSFGISAQWKALNVYSEGDQYINEFSTGDTRPREDFSRYTPASESLLGFTFGQVWNIGGHRLLMDLSYAPYSGYRQMAGRADPTVSKNISMGWQAPVLPRADILSGLSLTEVGAQNFYLLTGGLGFKNRNYDGSVGGFYKYTTDSRDGGLSSSTLGFLFSSYIEY
ncbi:hypothetical protein Bdt_3506 [Bdellovibrio bacteriovorus str. Tiberius]|uniref:Long-chain fatty acid transporter n=1 Tax=Bdellovibrio bacteriovorus str. Tiberius TaxID=1069642 RepID=K7YTD0_BDEBC|nr:hypothetical protein Bdt_3506 [Bdellovibrio bacteriovorus str. Tiberius]